MAAGDRTKLIRDRVLLALGIDVQLPIDASKLALHTIDAYQRRLAEDTLCLEAQSSLAIDADGNANEPPGFYRLKFIQPPSSSRLLTPKEVDPVEFDYFRFTTIGSATLCYYFKRWGGKLTFFPKPGVVSWTIHYYKLPTTNVGDTVDPETPALFDRAIEYGVLSELLPLVGNVDAATYYRGLFEAEAVRALSSFRQTKSVGLSVYSDVYE